VTRTLIRNADVLVTMDDSRRELAGASVLIQDGAIEAIGDGAGWPHADETINASGCVVTPGLVNTHHHLFQSLTRAVPNGASASLFDWLRTLYPIWARMRPEDYVLGAEIGLAELALSGCTLTSDHQYIFPNGARLDDTIEAARALGLRFHATRGAMSIGESQGGLPPDSVVEHEPAILDDCIRVADRFHDPAPGAMTRVALAPCSPFSVSRELMRDCAVLARDKGVMLHTHLAENDEDVAYSLEKFGCRPGEYAEQLGWVGADVWHAHCVKLDEREIALFARTHTGIGHCPCSNCRLGSGIGPFAAMGVRIGLGVDGPASNDAGHLLGEARQAMLLQRAAFGPSAMTPRTALELATRGGAQVLGRDDCGALAPGMRADLAVWDVSGLEAAGAWDAVAALVLCGPHRVKHLLVDGMIIVRDGQLTTGEPGKLAERARHAIARLC
jgi:cytosine/adenosine deaminase-related metal-dependent hydrolase